MVSVASKVLDSIQSTLGLLPAEKGGIIGGSANIITTFYFDLDALTDRAHYHPCIGKIASVIQEWTESGIQFLGIIHSHQQGDMRLSGSDISFAREIIRLNMPNVQFVYFPIVATTFDAQHFEMTIYRITLDTIEIEEMKTINHI